MRHLDRQALELSYLLKVYEALGVWPNVEEKKKS